MGRRKGKHGNWDYALLGWAVSANRAKEWAAPYHPITQLFAPEIARAFYSLQTLEAYTHEVIPVVVLAYRRGSVVAADVNRNSFNHKDSVVCCASKRSQIKTSSRCLRS